MKEILKEIQNLKNMLYSSVVFISGIIVLINDKGTLFLKPFSIALVILGLWWLNKSYFKK